MYGGVDGKVPDLDAAVGTGIDVLILFLEARYPTWGFAGFSQANNDLNIPRSRSSFLLEKDYYLLMRTSTIHPKSSHCPSS